MVHMECKNSPAGAGAGGRVEVVPDSRSKYADEYPAMAPLASMPESQVLQAQVDEAAVGADSNPLVSTDGCCICQLSRRHWWWVGTPRGKKGGGGEGATHASAYTTLQASTSSSSPCPARGLVMLRSLYPLHQLVGVLSPSSFLPMPSSLDALSPTPPLPQDFDVYEPNSKFSRKAAGSPSFRIVVVPTSPASSHPTTRHLFLGLGDMAAAERASPGIPVKFATVEEGDIAFYGFTASQLHPILQ